MWITWGKMIYILHHLENCFDFSRKCQWLRYWIHVRAQFDCFAFAVLSITRRITWVMTHSLLILISVWFLNLRSVDSWFFLSCTVWDLAMVMLHTVWWAIAPDWYRSAIVQRCPFDPCCWLWLCHPDPPQLVHFLPLILVMPHKESWTVTQLQHTESIE